jgi:hypothetical protein
MCSSILIAEEGEALNLKLKEWLIGEGFIVNTVFEENSSYRSLKIIKNDLILICFPEKNYQHGIILAK